MKDRMIRVISVLAVAATLIMAGLNTVSAAYKDATLHLKGTAWIMTERTGNYSYVLAKCVAVYPDGEYDTDNYTKIRCRITQGTNGTLWSDEYVLEEGKAGKRIDLYEGNLTYKKVTFNFYGNTTGLTAYTHVKYDPK